MLWPTNTCSILRTLNTRRFLQCIYSESREVCKPEKFLFPMLNEKETLSSRENFKVCHPLLCSLFVSLVTMTKLNYVLINNFIINQMCNLSYFVQMVYIYWTQIFNIKNYGYRKHEQSHTFKNISIYSIKQFYYNCFTWYFYNLT